MNNIELAWMFQEIADLMEIKGENHFKIRAYRNVAKTLTNLKENVSDLVEQNELRSIPGVGQAIQEKIMEWSKTGKIAYLEKLRTEVPKGVAEFTRIPGVGPRMAHMFFEKLGARSLGDLERAAKARQIRTLPGLGGKTELSIIQGIEAIKSGKQEFHLGVALPIALEIENLLKLTGRVEASYVGDLRRFTDTVSKLEFVASADNKQELLALFKRMPQVGEVKGETEQSVTVRLFSGIEAELTVVSPQDYVFWRFVKTGSQKHLDELNLELVDRRVKDEREIYASLGLPFIPPQVREGRGEISLVRQGGLRRLIALEDIRSDLHMHTNYSDGVDEIRDMALGAKQRGLEFIAICDHSRSLPIANGLSAERLHAQVEEVRRVSRELDFPILAGTECDILADGSLDYEDSLLQKLDIVVASIHSGFKQEGYKLTSRIISAIKNPRVHIIGHPTGRILTRRKPYEVDMEAIIQAASDYGKILELNATPDRLDLNDYYLRLAKDKGVKIAINTDAHSVNEQGYMFYGVNYAIRALIERDDVINTLSYRELLDYLHRVG